MVGISCNDKELDECHNEENMYSGVTGDAGDQYLEKSFDNSNKDIRDQNQGDLSAFKKFVSIFSTFSSFVLISLCCLDHTALFFPGPITIQEQ